MGMPDTLTPVYWTADMARRLPEDGNRYEVVYGELLVTPAPRLWHQILVLRLASALPGVPRWVSRIGAWHSPLPPTSHGDRTCCCNRTCSSRRWSRRGPSNGGGIRDLLLVAEVLSPSTPRHDRFAKRRRYQEARVPLYWIVDGDARQVEVWTPDDAFPRIEHDRLVWQPEGAGAPFTLPFQELFRAI